MDPEYLNEQESLQIIRKMIDRARGEVQDDGFFLLLWGWLVVIGSIAHFLVLEFFDPEMQLIPWIIVGSVGAALTFLESRRRSRVSTFRSYSTDLLYYLWIAIGASFFMIIGAAMLGKLTFDQAYPLFMVLYGLGTFVSGGALGFRPLVTGGMAAWMFAIAAFFVSLQIQLLLLPLSVIVSYLIPGYMLRQKRTDYRTDGKKL